MVAAGVASHWVLDFITHRPDLPLYPPDGPKVGLRLWDSLPATIALEFAIFGVGLWLYTRSTKPADAVGRWALVAFGIVLPLMYLASVFGPPPPDAHTIAIVAQGQWLLVAWGFWIDRHRRAVREWQGR
jgi:hypothetical protein